MFRLVSMNAAAILVARVIASGGGLALAALVAGRLGSRGFGSFAAVVAAVAVANLVITFGLDTVVVRSVADRRPQAAATIIGTLRLQLWGAGLASLLAIVLAGLSLMPVSVAVGALGLIPMGVTTVANAVLRGVQQMADLAAAALLSAAVSLAVAALWVEDQVWTAVAAVVIGQSAAAVFLAARALAHRPSIVHTAAERSGPGPGLRSLLGQAWIFAAATVASAVVAQGALIGYELLADDGAGALAAGTRLVEAVRLVPAAVFAALFPAMFDGVHRNPRYRWLFRAVVGYSLTAVGALLILAPWLAGTLFDDPPNGAAVIRIMAVGLLATVVRLRYSFELIAEGREATVLVSAVVAMTVALVGYSIGAATGRSSLVAAVQLAALFLNAALLAVAARRPGGEPTRIRTVPALR